ncbi:hypothetical protein CRG98_001392 [Punica granatum]|uniref:Uncharacterized protein n=1 Tax=Punica granatum TaxID=22663 RepID=A0A2I0LC24_PUNGR|nr:hypothetical protein CRG98_001392 [Punica granatum]
MAELTPLPSHRSIAGALGDVEDVMVTVRERFGRKDRTMRISPDQKGLPKWEDG